MNNLEPQIMIPVKLYDQLLNVVQTFNKLLEERTEHIMQHRISYVENLEQLVEKQKGEIIELHAKLSPVPENPSL